jgi:hypothetical protein
MLGMDVEGFSDGFRVVGLIVGTAEGFVVVGKALGRIVVGF